VGEPLMDFTNGEILIQRLRLIACALTEGSVIADLDRPRSAGPKFIAEAMSQSFFARFHPLVKSISGFSCSEIPIS
jgi:hypothetical protein